MRIDMYGRRSSGTEETGVVQSADIRHDGRVIDETEQCGYEVPVDGSESQQRIEVVHFDSIHYVIRYCAVRKIDFDSDRPI